jgi:hypothetical protein
MADVFTYYQSGEPTDMTPGTTWIDDGGYRRIKGINGAWLNAGNVNLDNLGSVNRSGDSMDGALQGAHGLAPLFSAQLTGTPRINSNEIADKPWVLTLLHSLKTILRDEISDATRKTSGSMALGENIAFGWGCKDPLAFPLDPNRALAHGEIVPLPSYSSGVPASKEEIVLLLPSVWREMGSAGSGNQWNINCDIDPETLIVNCDFDSGSSSYTGHANYVIVCMKK